MRVSTAADISNIKDDEIKRFQTQFNVQIKDVINGGVSFADNIKCRVLSVTFGGANQSTQVTHGLGSIPVGYAKIGGPNIVVFDASQDFTSENIYVQATAAGTVTLLILA